MPLTAVPHETHAAGAIDLFSPHRHWYAAWEDVDLHAKLDLYFALAQGAVLLLRNREAFGVLSTALPVSHS